jgi:transposase
MRAAAPQPIDLDGVRDQIAAMLASGRTDETIDLVIGLLAKLRDDNTRLYLDNARLLKKHLGQTSERVSPEQLSLLLSLLPGADAAAAAADAPMPAPAADLPAAEEPPRTGRRSGRRPHGRKPLPEHLPRIETLHPVPAEDRPCPICGQQRVCIGHVRSETLEFVPASFRVLVDAREKLACADCEKGVVTAPPPDKVIEKGRPGPGLLAQVIVSKYGDHLPLNRQHKIYLRDGVDLPVSTLADWVRVVHECTEPLARRIGELALASHVLQADDTGLKVLDRDEPRGARRGHLWCYAGDQRWAVFRYTPNWRKEGPQSFLAQRRGWLVADAYKGWDALFTRPGATCVEVGCWAHARRGFFELAEAGDARPAWVLDQLQDLYRVEAKATEDGVDHEERRTRRLRESAPIVSSIFAWCNRVCAAEPPQSAFAKAAAYVLNQQYALIRFTEDGRLPVDNTLVERKLRPIAVGRHNYLFCGSDAGAERAATAYTLLGTCALNGVEPRAYLTDVLLKLQSGWMRSRLDELLPPNWLAAAPASARVAPSR